MSGLAATLGASQKLRPRSLAAGITVHPALVALGLAFTLTVALSLIATPRRTGDAHQYVAMSIQLARLQPPVLSPEAQRSYLAWLKSQPESSGFPAGARAVRQPALIRDEYQEFSHFWVYPLFVAPVLAVTEAVEAHPTVAFAITNAVLLGAATIVSARVFGPIAALLMLASPLIWFVGRAQVEMFTVAFITLAMATAATGRWGWASLAIAAASTQNAPIAAAVPIFWGAGLVDWLLDEPSGRRLRMPTPAQTRQAAAFVFAGVVVALFHPVYYLVRLGVLTPQQLNGGIAGSAPSLGKLLAPVIDPDIGFLAWMPAIAGLTVAGLWLIAASWRNAMAAHQNLALTAMVALVLGGWFLTVVAQTTNVNSGGTVHVSRYALWLLPLTLPALAVASSWIESRAPTLLLVAVVTLFLLNLGYFRPDQPEQYVTHSPQATWLMTHLPIAYRPLPEVFVERTLHLDGGPSASAALPDCRLIFVLAANPKQPCTLGETEIEAMRTRFAAGDPAVWLRGAAIGEHAVTTAVAGR